MKIYAIKDRLIDYFMQPFVGPDDKSVLASVARLVNQGEVTSDITQAPHQFEVWTLGIVQEDGTLTPERQYLADCASLIRSNIRKDPRHAGDQETATSEIGRGRPPDQITGGNDTPPVTPPQGREESSHKPVNETYPDANRRYDG